MEVFRFIRSTNQFHLLCRRRWRMNCYKKIDGGQRFFATNTNSSRGNCSSSFPDTNFITTPIFYVNAAPHVGHLYCALLADASARWSRIKGKKTIFSTGTDEHGLKIQQAATGAGLDPDIFCNNVSQTFKDVFDKANIQYDRFIRTTESNHRQAVHSFWNTLDAKGYIYKGTYSGWYSVPDEAFLTEDEVEEKKLPDGTVIHISKESGHRVIWTEEKNYNFRLSDLKQDLVHWLNSNPIHPTSFEPAVRNMLLNLPDLSVSRDRSRLSWGIQVPDDPSQTIYVWLDALINYLTIAGYPHPGFKPWPPNIQIIGKDILKFHAIYWPAFLIAAGLAPPQKLVVHSHWLVDNIKMSKSLGNVVDPMVKMSLYGVDGFRYFLLKEGSLMSNRTYSDKRLVSRVNTDLANTIGNLLGRSTAPSVNKNQTFPAINEDLIFEFMSLEERNYHKMLYEIPERVDVFYETFQFTKALELILSQCHWANSFVQAHEPWVLAKSTTERDFQHLQVVLHVAMETLRLGGVLLQPIVPEVSNKLLNKLGINEGERRLENILNVIGSDKLLNPEKCFLYPKIKEES